MGITKETIAVLGMGYVGLPLALALGRSGVPTLGFDVNAGLVGGHCIGVDPYYLIYRAGQLGYHPEVILAGRRINDRMGHHAAQKLIKLMVSRAIHLHNARVLVLGFTFKENCADIRNTKVADIVQELQNFSVEVDIHDPRAAPAQIEQEYGLQAIEQITRDAYDAVIVAVAHDEFRQMGGAAIRALCKGPGLVYDIKGVFDKDQSDLRL